MPRAEITGMYVYHYPYGSSSLSEPQKRARRAEQHQRVGAKRQARRNGYEILNTRLV